MIKLTLLIRFHTLQSKSGNRFTTMNNLNFQTVHCFQICKILFQLHQPSILLTTLGTKFIYNLPIIPLSFETGF